MNPLDAKYLLFRYNKSLKPPVSIADRNKLNKVRCLYCLKTPKEAGRLMRCYVGNLRFYRCVFCSWKLGEQVINGKTKRKNLKLEELGLWRKPGEWDRHFKAVVAKHKMDLKP